MAITVPTSDTAASACCFVKQETSDNFRQVRREIADLREETMPLAEQSELRLRVHRIEDHLGLPHEVKPA